MLASLPKPKVTKYEVSLDQIEALEQSIQNAEAEIQAKRDEDIEMEDETDRLLKINQ